MLTLILTLLTPALAGEHQLNVDAGATALTRTDTMVSPLRLTGVLPRGALSWRYRGDRLAQRAQVGVAIGSLDAEPFAFTSDGDSRNSGPSVATLVDLQYAVGGRVDSAVGTFHIGGISANHAEDLVFYNGIVGLSHYLGAFELAPWVDWELQVGDRLTLGAEAWVPVAAWMGRNPYAVHSGEHLYNTRDHNTVNTIARHIADGRMQTVNHYQAVHLRPRVDLKLHEHWTLGVGGRFDWLHYTVPFAMIESQVGLDVNLQGRF